MMKYTKDIAIEIKRNIDSLKDEIVKNYNEIKYFKLYNKDIKDKFDNIKNIVKNIDGDGYGYYNDALKFFSDFERKFENCVTIANLYMDLDKHDFELYNCFINSMMKMLITLVNIERVFDYFSSIID